MQVLNIFHVLIAIALIAFVLIQKGQGATAGAAFGSGASGTVFGARGASNFLSRTTWVLAGLFCAISLTMAVLVSRMMDNPEVGLGVVSTEQTAPPVTETLPADESVTDESLFNAEETTLSTDVPTLDSSEAETATPDDLPPVSAEDDSAAENPGDG